MPKSALRLRFGAGFAFVASVCAASAQEMTGTPGAPNETRCERDPISLPSIHLA